MCASGPADTKGRHSHAQHTGLAFTCICLQEGRQVFVQRQGLNDEVRLEEASVCCRVVENTLVEE